MTKEAADLMGCCFCSRSGVAESHGSHAEGAKDVLEVVGWQQPGRRVGW